jgi:hypothetical protein
VLRKAYEKLLRALLASPVRAPPREEGRELWGEALEAYETLREALGGTGGLPGGPEA